MTHDCFVCFRQHSPHQILPALEFMWCLCLQMSVSTGLIPWTGCGLNICHNSICPHFIPGKMDCFPDSRPMPGLHNVGMPHLALGFSTLRAGLTYSSRWCGPQIHMWERYLSEMEIQNNSIRSTCVTKTELGPQTDKCLGKTE